MRRAPQVRLLQLAAEFRSGRRLRVRDLAAQYELNVRTIKRDLEALRDRVGMDLAYDRTDHTYRLLRENPPVSLTAEEFAALSLSAKLLRRVVGTRFEAPLMQALDKVSASFRPAVSWNVRNHLAAHSFGIDLLRGEPTEVAERLGLLHGAITTRNTIQARYFTASRDAERPLQLDPYHLHFHQDAWYCIGYCHWRQAVRTFALQRMQKLFVTRRRYDIPDEFRLDEYLKNAWGLEPGEPEELIIQFGRRTAPYIRERRWHPTQELQETANGGVLLRARVNCGGEVLRWVLQQGADAEVLTPEHLRAAVIAEVQGMRHRYGV